MTAPLRIHATVYDRSGIKAVHRDIVEARTRSNGTLVIEMPDGHLHTYPKGTWTSCSDGTMDPPEASE